MESITINNRNPEKIARQIKTLFEADIDTYVGLVNTYWNDTVTITVPTNFFIKDPADYLVDLGQFPCIFITPFSKKSQGDLEAVFINITGFIQDYSFENITTKVLRMAQAVEATLLADPELSGLSGGCIIANTKYFGTQFSENEGYFKPFQIEIQYLL